MKELKSNKEAAKNIMDNDSEFKGYTIEEIRFHRALVAMEAEFCKTKIMKTDTKWKLLYNFMVNVKKIMDVTYEEKNNEVTENDINYIIDYVNNGIKNIIKC